MIMNIISTIKINDDTYQPPYLLPNTLLVPEVIITTHDAVANRGSRCLTNAHYKEYNAALQSIMIWGERRKCVS